MTGTLNLGGNPPLTTPTGTSGYVLTSDGSGNITLAPNPGSSGGITLTPTAVKTVSNSPYTTAAGEFVVCDATSGSVTVDAAHRPGRQEHRRHQDDHHSLVPHGGGGLRQW